MTPHRLCNKYLHPLDFSQVLDHTISRLSGLPLVVRVAWVTLLDVGSPSRPS